MNDIFKRNIPLCRNTLYISLVIFFILKITILSAQSNIRFIHKSGIEVLFQVDKANLGDFIYDSQTKIYVDAITKEEEEKTNALDAIFTALNKYPFEVLRTNLSKIYIFKQLQIYNLDYGGTYSLEKKIIYLNYSSHNHIIESFHHEFSSFFLHNYKHLFDIKKWLSLNNFKYLELNGRNALKANLDMYISDSLNEKGLIYAYAQTNLENDFNSFAECILSANPSFWRQVEKCPILKEKAKLFIKFYYVIDNKFKETIILPEEGFKIE